MCRCLEKALQSRTEKLKVEQFFLSVLEIKQAVSAINLLDREILWLVTVHLPFEDQAFTADDFIPLIEGQGRQRLDLRIELHEFSTQVLEEVRKLLVYTSPLNSITIKYKTIDQECIELIAKTEHSSDGKTFFKFSIDHADDPIKEMATLTLSDNERHLNIFEIPSIMRSIAPNLGCRQIQSLRKVSRGIRHCVDYIKPDPHILKYYISLGNFLFAFIGGMMNEEISTWYNGSRKEEAVRFVNDFELNTRHQKSCMGQLSIKMDRTSWFSKEEDEDSVRPKVFKLLRDVLISRTSPLKVKILSLTTQCLVMNILPYLDAEYLELIFIRKIEEIDEECTIDLDEISKTEQWIKAKRLRIKDLTVRMSIQDMNILNFEWIDITLESMTQEDITYCRKATALGAPYRVDDDFEYLWYFRIENTPEYLHVVLEQGPLQIEGCSYFKKIHQNKTPFF
ncbi:hypothetical protein GCK72_021287 [Caenorhabditis remanei]|uniref:DUF38 domain-containing protein n=1 Tax=Caenorhabditis remanei TaxID=31234 RepID=A0A6A5GJ54_CAERE|nr:hypothetical protein GCK72_021287 [Caenorhabditis remanei]KAF1754723.1 hypothetical protein GCK72_021287 [Caenorhabditis remanei]